ncbi:unnamed protein product [Anisakis simplex]|uniref:Transmembrane protein n=1 Tax=Anisakis simplex TaxID=6269 RepID=A0A0M3KAG5_ANISI|nr:unnamed protein product [Anisakis simplex]
MGSTEQLTSEHFEQRSSRNAIHSSGNHESAKRTPRKGGHLKLLLCLTGTGAVLIGIPCIVMVGVRLGFFHVNDVGIAITYSGPGAEELKAFEAFGKID